LCGNPAWKRAGDHPPPRGFVAGDHADVFRAEDVAEGEEFLVGERLDRDGVVGAADLAEGLELEGKGDEGFPGAGGGVEDDIVVDEEIEDGFFLVVVGLGVRGGGWSRMPLRMSSEVGFSGRFFWLNGADMGGDRRRKSSPQRRKRQEGA
jgi:hypothetical protein